MHNNTSDLGNLCLFLAFLTCSISGENKHFETPTNPAVHARVPGGSSGGAAVAVAADLVEFSLGGLLLFWYYLFGFMVHGEFIVICG